MEITYNDQIQEVKEETSVLDFVFSQIGEKQNGIAVAINDSIVPKSEWAMTYLKANDNLLIIKATQGG
ncbi:sulfur carrier protein ThiS [Algoriphagus sp. AGSA1]|uniref:sulfur carrier protein ThiS n=1 Tax=Algoriphagus sp. AGSA1 TaxID=2907213 RepID=UPI001F409E7B|nr:sulfur carrier protein ThiS [Algoriphagus sp. AGSA1]MCE7054483.1 sulfur carrier protein ThiS [Algoriphagus sp. AGSA1]